VTRGARTRLVRAVCALLSTPIRCISHECEYGTQESVRYYNCMSDVVYRSEVQIERVKGPVRRAYLPAESQPVIFGVHSAVAEHYKVAPGSIEPRATTLDYIVAATAG
jgi:hypothetical protein